MVAFSAAARAVDAEPDTVVLLHGVGVPRWTMSGLAAALERDGYRVVNLAYPSRTVPLETLGRAWLPQQLAACGLAAAPRMHFVTHSMGGIVLRAWLRDTPPPANLGRVVMLAPPNAGSEVVDRLRAFPPFRWFTGLNGARLGTGPDSFPRALGPWPPAVAGPSRASAPTTPDSSVPRAVPAGALGIIAGDRTLNPLFSAWLPGPDDGKVAVAATHLAGERDHVVLHHSHPWLAWRGDTAAQVRAFLRDGKFVAAGRALHSPPA